MKLLKIAVNESVEGATRRACGVWWVRRLPCSWLRAMPPQISYHPHARDVLTSDA